MKLLKSLMEGRTCRKCNQEKHPSDFYDRNKRRQFTCKSCEKLRIKSWRDANPDKQKKITRRAWYKRTYGVDIDQINTVGTCVICERENAKLVADHDHKTGKFREFICYPCNNFLGHIEKEKKFKNALAYLDKHGS